MREKSSIQRIVRFMRDYWFNELRTRNGREYASSFYRLVFIASLFPIWVSIFITLIYLDIKFGIRLLNKISKMNFGSLIILASLFSPYIYGCTKLLKLVEIYEIDENWSKTNLTSARKYIIPFLLISIALLFLIPNILF